MTALDSAFLQLEDQHAALHIGSIGVFEGPVPAFAAIRDEIDGRLHLVPRYRQRMRVVPGNLGRPLWEDDPDFDIAHHLHRSALPHPGGDDELADLVGRIMSTPLDHDRPLWEDWVVEGLANGRWALITKVHHSMVDGVAGTDLLTTLFGHSTETPAPIGRPRSTSQPRWPRSRLVLAAARTVAADSSAAALAAASSVRHPRRLADTARTSIQGLLHFLTAARPVSRSSLVGPLGTERSYRWAEIPLQQALELRSAYGCTVNDVVLAAVTVGFHDLLVERGESASPFAVRTLVPVSVRRPDQRGDLDNRVSAILLDLPVDESDAVTVLGAVVGRMRRMKATHEAEAGELVTTIGNVVPPPVLAAGLRLTFRVPQRFLTTVVTNVPGPREELRLGGCRMVAAYPYVPIADRVRIGIAVTSYAGSLLFGITADRDSTPDVDLLRDGLLRAFAELARRADQTDGSR
jgi:diacylglycerol O-acyltransferase